MLPYGLQLVGLSAWLGEDPQPGEIARNLLRRWLWLTGFASWFGQGNPSRYAAVLAELRDQARKVAQQGSAVPERLEHLPWNTPTEPFPERYDLRSARVRTLLCLLARRGVVEPNGERKSVAAIADDFARNGPEAMRTLWVGSPSLRSSPANRMFNVFGEEPGQARTLLRKIQDHRQDFLESHLLPCPLGDALNNPDKNVLASRLQSMIELEREFMTELEIQAPASAQTGKSLIDQDDEPPLTSFDSE